MFKNKGTRIPGLKSGKTRQYVLLAGVLAALYGGMYLIFATTDSEPKERRAAATDVNTTHIRAPGQQVDPKDAWLGGAGAEVAQMRERLQRQDQSYEALNRRFNELQERLTRREAQTPPPAPAPAEAVEAAPAPVAAGGLFPPSTPGTAASALANGTPVAGWVGGGANRNAPLPAQAPPPVRALGQFRVTPATASASAPTPGLPGTGTVRVAASTGADKPASGAKDKDNTRRSGETFLPVGMVDATLIGGLDAPTGGQAQSHPLPVMLRINDLAILPNHFRANLKECFAVGAAYGDLAAERAYARIELLSCIRHDGQVLETPVHGVIYDETGKLGVRGYVRTKQGQILANALIAGVVGGIGRGFAQSATQTSSSAIGTISTTTGSDAYRAGFGRGMGRAFDRLADYYIRLAEQLFPVIEVHGGRRIAIAFTRGVTLPVPLPDSNQIALGYFDED